jgi:FemAB-related protein (PEP-CTERM system-associated)
MTQLTQRTAIYRYDVLPGGEWERAVQHSAQAHLAEAPGWFEIIARAYGHGPVYLRAEDGLEGPVVLPAFLVRRPLLGTVVTSMPFLDAGGPCGDSGQLADALVSHLVHEAQRHGASQVELRCLRPMNLPIEASLEKVTLSLSLPADPDRLWRKLDAKVRNQVRKAERSGISIEVGGLALLNEFYQAFAVNMRDLGSPVHSRRFFRVILENFGDAAQAVLVRKNGVTLGGLISLVFKDTLYVPWASTLRKHAALCPNMLLYWETLRRGCKDGLARFDFGRSTRGSGTYRFKRQWGADELQLYWYTLPIGRRPIADVSRSHAKWALMSQLWRHLPVRVSRALGPRIRKYLTQ